MKKNIAIIIPTLSDGGAERVASNLSLYLPEDKYNKYIIVYSGSKIDYSYGGTLIDLKTESTRNIFYKMVNFSVRFIKIRNIKRYYNINTTVSLLQGPNLFNILTTKEDKKILSIRSYITNRTDGFSGKLNMFLVKILYNKSDIIVSVSEALKIDLVNSFGLDLNKIITIYNPYNIEDIEKLSKEIIEDDHASVFINPTIITVGRLSKIKGQFHLIRSLKKIKESIPDVNLVILGQGEIEDYLKKLVIDLKLEKEVFFWGFQKNPFKYIAKSSVFVLPSLCEGFPNVLCEAMACHVPVIASDCKSGPREILAPNTDIYFETKKIEYAEYGILVPVCDGNMYKHDEDLTNQELLLSKSIIEIMSNKDIHENYSQKSFQRVRDFDKKNILQLWESIL